MEMLLLNEQDKCITVDKPVDKSKKWINKGLPQLSNKREKYFTGSMLLAVSFHYANL